MGFVQTIGDAIAGKKISDVASVSDPISKMRDVLDTLSQWADQVEPVEQEQRFGNKAYRTWHEKLTQVSPVSDII